MSFINSPAVVQHLSDEKTSFDFDVEKIRNYLVDIANTYLLVAYRVYEIDYRKSYKANGYKNIVEACSDAFGFSKTTTYNLLGIVKRFGKPDLSGFITYESLFGINKFCYSQLCEMLSLSDNQLSKVTPDTTVKEIREIKKVPTSGKVVDDDYFENLYPVVPLRSSDSVSDSDVLSHSFTVTFTDDVLSCLVEALDLYLVGEDETSENKNFFDVYHWLNYLQRERKKKQDPEN
jgi:hypothetical protein